jgi:hypothetical protein
LKVNRVKWLIKFGMWQLAKEHGGILKYVQMSCLAAAPHSPSRLLRSKHAGEEAVLQNFPEVWASSFPSYSVFVVAGLWSITHFSVCRPQF